MTSILEKSNALLPQIIEWRRYIHRHAELSFQEHGTQQYICQILSSHGIEHRRIARTGVLAILNGADPDPQRPMVLRADMDALPIAETAAVDFACQTGNMHACGHDMHTASLLGALVLLKNETFSGTVWGLFQPGEELHPGGASIVLKEGVFDDVEPRFFIGQHCSPELEVGVLGFCEGQFMASTDELHITVTGRGGHAAMPHLINDTVLATSAMIVALQQIVSRRANAFTPTVISFGRVIADGATNVIPSKVEVEGTFRTMDEGWRAEVKTLISQIANDTVKAYGCLVNVDIKDGYPAVINNTELTAGAFNLARGLFGESAAQKIPRRMTAEDFGFYAARYPALFYRLGTGESAPLHNSAFCPDERALAYGAAMMSAVILNQN